MRITCFQTLNHLVSIHRMLAYVDDTNGNVGAMVTYSLKVGNEIRPNKSGFHSARAFLKSCDVVVTEKRFQIVDHLFKRLNVVCESNIVIDKGCLGQGKYFIRCGAKNGKLLSCGRRELNAFFTELLHRFKHVYGVVGDTLEVTDRFEKLGNGCAILVGHLTLTEPCEIGSENILVVIGIILDLSDFLGNFGGIIPYRSP